MERKGKRGKRRTLLYTIFYRKEVGSVYINKGVPDLTHKQKKKFSAGCCYIINTELISAKVDHNHYDIKNDFVKSTKRTPVKSLLFMFL